MATIIIGDGPNNNGGVVVSNGTVSGTFTSISMTQENVGVFGSTVVEGTDTTKALSAGVFAYSGSEPIAKRVTTSLGTVANDVLLSGAGQPALIQSVHKFASPFSTRKITTAIREGYWNEYTGEFDSGYPLVVTDTFLTDNAANPSRDVPGTVTFAGQSATSTSNYSKKTG